MRKYIHCDGEVVDSRLTKRYQLSENIRTIRQLSMILLLHLLNALLESAMVLVIFYNPGNYNVKWTGNVISYGTSLSNYIIQVLVIK